MKTDLKNKQESNDYNWRMYELLIVELRHLHTVWIDNFRVILTFNSILLSGAFAVFPFLTKDKSDAVDVNIQFLPWPILVIACVGIFTTL